MTGCLDVRENICAFIDEELSADERRSFEEHIKICSECKSELDEMICIVGLCTSLPQKELPAGFKSELHEKLLAVADKHKDKSKSIRGTKSFFSARTIASVAAGVLLVFLAGSFIRLGLFSPKMTAKSSDMNESAAMEAAPAAPEADLASDGAGASIQAEDAADQNVVTYSIASSGSVGLEVDRSATAQERETSSKIAGKPDEETVSSKTSTVTITAQEPAKLIEKVDELAFGNNGEKADNNDFYGVKYSSAEMPANEAQMTARIGAADSGEAVQDRLALNYVFPETNYNQFISSLNDTFGASNVLLGAYVSEDMTNILNAKIDESNEIDVRMQELQKNAAENSDEINKLKNKKELVDGQVEAIRLGSDFVNVTVFINQK